MNLKRSYQQWFETLEEQITTRYLTQSAMECFGRVKPSESRKTLAEVSKDLFALVQQFKGQKDVSAMYSYKLLERVLNEQCNLTDDKDHPVELKAPKQIASDSLQNPSDPDASYSGHKGQGYQVQIMETYSDDQETGDKALNLITHVEVEPAHKSDADALLPAMESTDKRGLKPKQLTADTLYGSDDNWEQADLNDVELIAPTMGNRKTEKLSLADFEISTKGQITACPQGHAPGKIKKRKRISIGFASEHCQDCPRLTDCPVKKGKKYFYLRVSAKDIRLAKRRVYERSEEFKDRYRWRAGVEATMSQYDRLTGVKNLRIRGMEAVKYCATLKALAVNIFRAAAVRASKIMPEEFLWGV